MQWKTLVAEPWYVDRVAIDGERVDVAGWSMPVDLSHEPADGWFTINGRRFDVVRYPLPRGEAWHLDLYRIAGAGELEFLGLDEAEVALWLVEWPQRGAGGLPAADLQVDLAVSGAGRTARLSPRGPVGEAWVKRMESSADLQPLPESGP